MVSNMPSNKQSHNMRAYVQVIQQSIYNNNNNNMVTTATEPTILYVMLWGVGYKHQAGMTVSPIQGVL